MVFRHLNSSLCWLFICVKQPNNKANVKPARNGDITTKVKKNSTTEKNPRNHVTDITRMSLARSGMRPFANPVGPHTVPHVKMSGTDSAFLLSIKLLCLSFFCSGFSLFPLKEFLCSVELLSLLIERLNYVLSEFRLHSCSDTWTQCRLNSHKSATEDQFFCCCFRTHKIILCVSITPNGQNCQCYHSTTVQ